MSNTLLVSSEARQVRDAGDSALAQAAKERQELRDELIRLAAIIAALQEEKKVLLLRANKAETQVRNMLITSGDEIVAGMRDWLMRDEIGIATALKNLVRQAVSK